MKLVRGRTILLLAATMIGFTAGEAPAALTTQRVASGLLYPVFATAPAGDSRLFILEQQGRIRILQNGTLLATPFLDIHAKIPNVSGNDERGLLGLAFHPNYATNGYFYVYYIDLSSNSVVMRYHVSGNPNIADTTSAFQIIHINQPYTNHKGGTLLFGPNDGYLYLGLGDGGSEGDPLGNGQNTGTLLSKIIRIDVDHGSPYSIPPDNPFVGPGNPLDEIWDIGLRNPYRWSFDRATGDMWIGDVGQNSWEEIDFEAAHGHGGFNYGWSIMEGDHCYNPPSNCNETGLTLPIYEYDHGQGCAITGGYVYRGNAIPSLRGTYFFADFCSAQIWSFRYDGSSISEFTNRTAELAPGGGLSITNIAGFGEDGQGEMYIVDRGTGSNGEVYKIELNPAGVPGSGGVVSQPALAPAAPNPFTGSTQLAIVLDHASRVDAEVLDAAGRVVRSLAAGEFDAGRHVLVWDGTSEGGARVPSGVYFVRARWDGAATRAERIQLVR